MGDVTYGDTAGAGDTGTGDYDYFLGLCNGEGEVGEGATSGGVGVESVEVEGDRHRGRDDHL